VAGQGGDGASSALADWAPYKDRLRAWRQQPDRAVADAESAADLIDSVAIATVYPTSPEIANLFHAHMGDPFAKTEMKWDSPSGRVYTWRWTITKTGRAFYAPIVKKRATFVIWPLVPALLRLVGDLRTPDELFDFGVISADAYKIAQALDGAEAPKSTGEIRKLAGFPTGKDHSARYHKALAELESRLLVTTEFPIMEGRDEAEDGSKHHGLMFERRRADVDQAAALTIDEALDALLPAYLGAAQYIVPVTFAKNLRLDPADVLSAVQRMESAGSVTRMPIPGGKSDA